MYSYIVVQYSVRVTICVHPAQIPRTLSHIFTLCLQCAENSSENLSCKVCGAVYQLERGRAWWIGQGFTPRHWLQTATLVTVMCGTIAGAWTLIQMYDDAYIRSLAAGATLLIIYVCLR